MVVMKLSYVEDGGNNDGGADYGGGDYDSDDDNDG